MTTRRTSPGKPPATAPRPATAPDPLRAARAAWSAGDHAACLTAARSILDTRQHDLTALHLAAACCIRLGRPEDARSLWERAVAAHPQDADAYNNLGNLYLAQERTEDAKQAYLNAIASRPSFAEPHHNLGNLYYGLKDYVQAEAACRRAIAARTAYPEALNTLGNVLFAQGRTAEAEAAYRQAIALRPADLQALSNLGILLRQSARLDEAVLTYQTLATLQPRDANTHLALANLFKDLQRFDEAKASYLQAIEVQPGHADARFALGMLLLSLGQFAEGWPLYEARYDPGRAKPVRPPSFAFPPWRGEHLTGKRVLVWPEQGLGDEIQFARYVALLKARGARHVTWACRPPLERLFKTLAAADLVLDSHHVPVSLQHDYWTSPLRLPLHCKTTLDSIPADVPYLSANPADVARWAPRLPHGALKVGLVWKGRAEHRNDANRSLQSLAELAPLWSVPGAVFVSLQKGSGEVEAASPPAGQPLTHLGSDIQDLADTAAILAGLDLVICVDTAIAHLAGALGKPCWVLLPRLGSDWRWLHGREDSPWYPRGMRLMRQTQPGDWSGPVAACARALRDWGQG